MSQDPGTIFKYLRYDSSVIIKRIKGLFLYSEALPLRHPRVVHRGLGSKKGDRVSQTGGIHLYQGNRRSRPPLYSGLRVVPRPFSRSRVVCGRTVRLIHLHPLSGLGASERGDTPGLTHDPS